MFVICIYDRVRFIGVILDKKFEHNNVIVKFMNKNMENNSFSWPPHVDICWLPVTNILCKITTLLPQNVAGRLHTVSADEYNKIMMTFSL